MRKITVDVLMEIHLIAIESGDKEEMKLRYAVRDQGTLEYIADRANRINDELDRAAFLLYSIANYHPFVDGNKRTAILSADLVIENYIIDPSAPESDALIRNIAAGQLDELQIKEWIKTKLVKYP